MAILIDFDFVSYTASGAINAGGSVAFYDTGTSTPKTVYSDAALTTPLSNPFTLDNAGRFSGPVYAPDGERYAILERTSGAASIRTRDPVWGTVEDSLTSSYTSSYSGASARTLQSRLDEKISVKDFGAVGNGTTNDAVAIQAAIDAAELIRGTVYFPATANHYYCATQLTINAPIALLGDAGLTRIKFASAMTVGTVSTTGEGCIDVLDVKGFSASGLTFVTMNNVALSLRGCREFDIVDNRFLQSVGETWTDDSAHCVLVQRSPNVSAIENFRITDNFFEPGANAILVIGGTTSGTENPTNFCIANNQVDCGSMTTAGTSSLIKIDRFCTNWVIAANQIWGNGATSASFKSAIIAEEGSAQGVISNNSIHGYVGRGIELNTDNAAGADAFHDILIVGNGIYAAQGSGGGYGIYLETVGASSTNITVRGNHIVDSEQSIREETAGIDNLVVEGNTSVDCTGIGILIKSNNAIVRNNSVLGSQASYSYRDVAGATGQIITDNIFEQADSGSEMDVVGTPAVLARNLDASREITPNQTRSGAGSINVFSEYVKIVTTGADALTLADGYENQHKYIVMQTDGGAGTLTPTNLGNGTTITFDDVGDSAHLLFLNGAWHFMGGTATLA